MCRIGLDQPEPDYLDCVTRLTENSYFFAIMGGVPKRAHLILHYQDGYFGYLDPHQTFKAPKVDADLSKHENEYKSDLSWLKKSKIDSSMAISFFLPVQDL